MMQSLIVYVLLDFIFLRHLGTMIANQYTVAFNIQFTMEFRSLPLIVS